jgi:hypothetical protein
MSPDGSLNQQFSVVSHLKGDIQSCRLQYAEAVGCRSQCHQHRIERDFHDLLTILIGWITYLDCQENSDYQR